MRFVVGSGGGVKGGVSSERAEKHWLAGIGGTMAVEGDGTTTIHAY